MATKYRTIIFNIVAEGTDQELMINGETMQGPDKVNTR